MDDTSKGCGCLFTFGIGIFIFAAFSGCAEEKHKEEACQYFIDQAIKNTVPDADIDTLSPPADILDFSERNLPLLHSKWTQIQENYNSVSANINIMEKKYANLVFVYGAQKANRPKSYEQWLRRQKQEMQKLKKTHDNILNHVERYYAEAAVRQIDSDAEIKAEVNSLIKSADIVLQNQFNN